MNGSARIVRCRENEGVRHVFGVPGEGISDRIDSDYRENPKPTERFGHLLSPV